VEISHHSKKSDKLNANLMTEHHSADFTVLSKDIRFQASQDRR